ncbi:hypothetical protein DMB42_05795 [Nonomuraea sp. WAC 01424]|uniref:hypothetical protein n=1 Tax=Nonomuraea sp. WAC 01424 TaxID=2203200 RepID=UPI000F7AB6A3|nr:hypothetical protein [Nonomuraea sp. WAC 01424]RSN14071.1 hypothetical protein DMB42_05795 [Nonomuraea sp. WAC 01424]
MVDRPEEPEPTGDGRLAAVTVLAVIVVLAAAGVAVGAWWSLKANAEEARRVQAANLREMSVVIAGRLRTAARDGSLSDAEIDDVRVRCPGHGRAGAVRR